MKIITNGLIIREQSIGERDKLITVLTDSNGVIKGFAKGAKDIKSSKCAATELLAYSRLTLHKSGESYIISDPKPIRLFPGLRSDVAAMYLGQYFCELAPALCPHEQEAGEQLRLILNALYLLSEKKREPLIVKVCTELRLMCLAGYMPDLTMCRVCGEYEKETMCFTPRSGGLVCLDCREKEETEEAAITLSSAALRALRHCVFADDKKLFSFTLPGEELKRINFCSEEYMRFMLERGFKTLAYLRDVL